MTEYEIVWEENADVKAFIFEYNLPIFRETFHWNAKIEWLYNDRG
jgi:hypothetical protein